LNIRSEKKWFGHDVAKLIQAKNDYKHDRGPTVLEDIAEASQEVQERLKRCMERLFFFGDYPIRQVEDFNVSRSGNEVFLKTLRYMGDYPSFPQEEVVFYRGLPRGDLFLDLEPSSSLLRVITRGRRGPPSSRSLVGVLLVLGLIFGRR
jgi:hypothetical protein